MNQPKERVALVTGAGKNIGRAIALSLAHSGHRVVVNGRQDREAVDEVVAEIHRRGGDALGIMGDVSKAPDVERIVEQTIGAYDRLDTLVSNAGLRRQTPFLEMNFAEWREILSVALDGAFLLARAAVPHMLDTGGAIVALSGVSTHVGTPQRCHVSASKAGLEGLIRALAVELAPHEITCNTIAPGAIDTVRGVSAGAAPGNLKVEGIPLGRKGTVEEIASLVSYLASEDARYITGQTLHVNGGSYLT